MNHRNLQKETNIATVLLFLVFLLLNPFNLYMLSMFAEMVLVLISLTFIVLAVFIWREQPHDEREQLHLLTASRFSYLCGVGILIVGIVLDQFFNLNYQWVLLALVGMLLVKIFSQLYLNSRR